MDQQNQRKVDNLEKQLQLALRQLNELNKKVTYLERENNRRKTEINQVVSALKRS